MLPKTRTSRIVSLNSSPHWVVFSKIQRVHFSFDEFNDDNGDFQVVKTMRMFIWYKLSI